MRFSHFKQAQKQKSEHGVGENIPGAETFFHKRQIGSWCEELTSEQADEWIAEHFAVMKLFGYLTETGESVF